MALVGIVIGSKTDEEFIQPALDIFKEFKIEYEIAILSAHRKPDRVRQYALEAGSKGYEVIIAA
ncbi:MAG: AIR carboxylase family protein, partial [Chloroflexi bacterium]|nr:AIR carboxylase family protein [Chloroflexota bacterium]